MLAVQFDFRGKLLVSNKIVTQPTCPNPSDPARKSADPTLVTVDGGSWPPKPENGWLVGGFSLQNPKKPNRTEISAFPAKFFSSSEIPAIFGKISTRSMESSPDLARYRRFDKFGENPVKISPKFRC